MLVAEEAVEIRVLRRQGKSIREIARMLGVSRNTVRRCLRSVGLPRYEREARPSKLDPFKSSIASCTTRSLLASTARASGSKTSARPDCLRELQEFSSVKQENATHRDSPASTPMNCTRRFSVGER